MRGTSRKGTKRAQTEHLTNHCQAVKILRSMLERGYVNGNEDVKNIWKSDEIFQRHKLVNFFNCFKNMAKEFRNHSLKNMLSIHKTRPQY